MSSNNKNFRVLVDLDGVCADIHPFWLSRYNYDFGDNLTEEDILGWDMHRYVKEECGHRIYDYLKLPGFFYMAPAVPGCEEALKIIHDAGIEIVICTASPQTSQTGCFEKMQWVLRHLPFIDKNNFVATHSKNLVRGDLLLDDGAHNLLAFPGATCAFERPWNRGCEADHHVSNWEEFTKLILTLAKDETGAYNLAETNV